MNLHLKRWITGIIAAPLLVAFIINSSEEIFSFFILSVIQLALWEYNGLVFEKNGNFWEKAEVSIFALIIPLALYHGDSTLTVSVVSFSLLTSFLVFLLQIRDDNIDLTNVGKVILGFMYMPFFLSFFILLRLLDNGILWVFFVLVIAFSGDVIAFYTGKAIGKRKLQPFVSPGKTVEGTVGLVIGSIAGSFLFQTLVFTELPLIHAVILGVFGGILGQLGDLFESAIKRAAGAKDAGFIFPGHGGILDRLDSLSFIVPFVYCYQHFVIR